MIVVRPEVTVEDAKGGQAVFQIATAALREIYRPKKDVARRTAATYGPLQRLVAWKDGHVVGIVEYVALGSEMYIQGLAVHPDHRRQGVAKALLRHVVAAAQREGKQTLRLSTIKETGNVPIFERLGFAVMRETIAEHFEGVHADPVTQVDMVRKLMTNRLPNRLPP